MESSQLLVKRQHQQHVVRNNAHPYCGNKNGDALREQVAVTVSCNVYMISSERFEVQASSYHSKLIEVFKSIKSRSYDVETKNWNFALNDYRLLQERTLPLKPDVAVRSIPKAVFDICLSSTGKADRSCLISIEPSLSEKLIPFQQDGVWEGFAISQHGRAMTCDEMGLGKTYQTIAIASFYQEDWPLLICTTASTRDSWATHIRELLPSLPVHYIQILSSGQQYINELKVLITSYSMMERHVSQIMERKFGFLIFDESQNLKNSKAKCTIVADRLYQQARSVILLSGTPALSRPVELTKAEVVKDMSTKIREVVTLDPAIVCSSDEVSESLKAEARNLQTCNGENRSKVLLKFYAQTAKVKTRVVCSYLKQIVKGQKKFIVFAHHRVMLDAISYSFNALHVTYIRIDGGTSQQDRGYCVDHFQKTVDCQVAVLSLGSCNSGITVTAADLIIFAELTWNPTILAQAESRSHRIGQPKPVIRRYLMAKQTADDHVWNLLKTKQDILKKAGIFCENLQDTTNAMASTKIRLFVLCTLFRSSRSFCFFILQQIETILHRRPSEVLDPSVESSTLNDVNETPHVSKNSNAIEEFFRDDDEAFLNISC
uniref:SWI/SNF-related matrix-associated actin-dependent regulator of chromatin subfamily A-like protein 1 n=1 Tax=Glossina morsitans morsitans TaxID=37546 RepID=A0A1B0G5L7_GLOMM